MCRNVKGTWRSDSMVSEITWQFPSLKCHVWCWARFKAYLGFSFLIYKNNDVWQGSIVLRFPASTVPSARTDMLSQVLSETVNKDRDAKKGWVIVPVNMLGPCWSSRRELGQMRRSAWRQQVRLRVCSILKLNSLPAIRLVTHIESHKFMEFLLAIFSLNALLKK